MTTSSLAANDRRALFVGGSAILIMVALGLGLPASLTWRASIFEYARQESNERAHIERSLTHAELTSRQLRQLRAQLAIQDSVLLRGASVASAEAALAGTISETVEGTGVELGSIQIRTDTIGTSQLVRTTAHTTVSGDIETLVLFLQSLEAGPPMLAIREWAISGGDANLPRGQREVLRLDVLVEGLSRRPAERPAR